MNHHKYHISTILYILIFLFCHLSSTAYEPKLRHFDVSDGLPSSTVYQVFQDSKGYIWFCTEAGLTRFDGTYIDNYTMDDGLADNEVFGLFEDSQGRIWTRCFNGKFSYFQDGYVYNALDIPIFKEMESGTWATQIYEDSQGNVYFAMGQRGFVVLTIDNQVIKKFATGLQKQINDYITEKKISKVYETYVSVAGFKEFPDGAIKVICSNGEFIFNPETRKTSLQKLYDNEISEVHFVNDETVLATRSSAKQLILQYKNRGFRPILNDKNLSNATLIPFQLNEKGQLWLGTLGSGIYLMNDFMTKPTKEHHYLRDKAVSYFLEDTEGNLWFSTLNDGVYMLPKNSVLTYTEEEGLTSKNLYAINGNGSGTIYVGNDKGALNTILPNGSAGLLETGEHINRSYDRITDILVGNDGTIWVSSDVGLTAFGKNIHTDISNVKSLSKDKKGNIYAASGKGVYKVNTNGKTEELWDKRATAVFPNEDNTVWIGSNNGLYFYDGKSVISQKSQNELFTGRVADLEKTTDNILCICTGNGVILKKGSTVEHLTALDGLVGNLCRDLFIEQEDNTVWMAANTGISHFKINPTDLSLEYIINHSESDNLASNDIRGIYADDNRVWLATSDGLSYFDAKPKADASIPPPVYITKVKIWEQDTLIHDVYNLPYHQDNIKIEYAGISFRSGNRIIYQYKMEGIDTDWVTSYVTEAQYPDLRPGVYTFKVKAINVDQIESVEPAEVTFIIHSPWWKTWWFRLFGFVVISGLIYLITTYLIKNRRQKELLQRQIVESEQMALRAQMNPHFVFNALNSIQHFITMEDEMSANYYLTRFSKLIRRVLENSKHSFITINEEIETLQLYLELEMLRFENKFEYNIDIDDEIDDYDTQIPSMIIQPFLENAIWHGLMPKVGESKLNIEFEQEDNFIICKVKDNGVGRKAAAEANKTRNHQHKSTGIANTVKRLSLLSNIKDESTLMQITDLEENGEAKGTLVTLKIPIKKD